MKFRKVAFLSLLSDIVDNRGKTCPISKSGISLIATNCIKNEYLYPVYEKVRYVDKETYKNWFRGHPKPGDIIFVTKGSPGQTNWVPDQVDFCIAQDMVSLRVNEDLVYPKYLFAILRSKKVQQMIESMHVGTLIPHFKKGDFDKLILDIHEDYGEQKWIGDLYFQFCEKIEQNILMNKTLEKMAMAIYKEWFVDSNINDYIEIKEYVVANPKLSIKKDAEVLFVDMQALSTDSLSVSAIKTRPYSSGSKFQNGDTLLARITPCLENGKTAFVDFLEENEIGNGSTEFIVLRPKNNISNLYVYCLCRDNSFRNHAISCMTGTSGRQRVQLKPLMNYTVKKIDFQKMNRFHNQTKTYFELIRQNTIENNTLKETRDYLLPKLISGKIRVKPAEEKMKEVS